jgi:MFS family permease
LNAPLNWYLTSTASFLVPGGIQMVLFPWLVAVLLHESADRVGLAQMCGALPALFLILFGGVVGDRFDQRRILIALHVFGSLPPFVLALVVGAGRLSYGVMIGYALIGGIVGAFAQPARDALLSRVAGDRVQRTVTLVLAMQFGVQIVGIGLGSFADRIGAVALIATQATVMAAGAFAASQIRVDPFVSGPRAHPLREIGEALGMVLASERMLPVVVLTFAIGVFFAGAFTVLIPLIVRDVYHGGAGEIGVAYVLNMIGTVAATVLLLARGGVARPGRAVLVGLGGGALLFVPIVWGVPIEAFYALILVWGAGGGITMSMTRSIVQESAPSSHRARIMAVYSLGMMGGMPLGSATMGFVIKAFGPLNAAWVPVIGMGVVVAGVAATTKLWSAKASWELGDVWKDAAVSGPGASNAMSRPMPIDANSPPVGRSASAARSSRRRSRRSPTSDCARHAFRSRAGCRRGSLPTNKNASCIRMAVTRSNCCAPCAATLRRRRTRWRIRAPKPNSRRRWRGATSTATR